MMPSKEKISQATIPQGEQPYQAPENWLWLKMDSLIEILNGYAFKSDKYVESGIRIIRIANVQDGYIEDEKPAFYPFSTENEIKKYILVENDLLISLTGNVGRVALLNASLLPAALNQRVGCLRVRNALLNKSFLYYYLLQKEFQDSCIKNSKGSAQLNMSTEWLKEQPFPLPPLAEQQRIVDRIESLFTKLDEVKEKAQVVVDEYEDRKAAILHRAFTGELTAEWRRCNTPSPAQIYLMQIKESENCFSRKEFDFWTNDNLPEGWAESKIGNLLYFAGRIGWKGLKAEEYTDEGPLLLSVYNLNDGDEVTYHHVNHISEERYEESPEIMVQEGDVLLAKDGAGIGKIGFVNELPQKATINSSLLLIRPANAARPKYIYYALLGPNLQSIVKNRITGSATPHLFQRDIKDFVLPVPPLEEQDRIIFLLDQLLADIRRAKELAERVIEQIGMMKKSILAHAFRGKIGTNDPTDESAEELLKREL